MSQGSRQKHDAGLARNAGGAASSSSSPGRRSLSGDGLEGDGLPYKQRSLFESSLGRDLADVRVHTDSDEASELNARAFARGSRIDFAPGQYNPGTPEGDALLAHEVAHVVQQRGAQDPGGEVGTTTPGDAVEQNADAAVGNMLAGTPTEVASAPVAIARKTFDESVDVPVADGPSGEAPAGDAPTAGGESESKEGEEEVGDLSVEQAGTEEHEGDDQPVGPPQDLEGGKADLAAAGAALPPQGGAEELAAGGPPFDAPAAPSLSGDDGEQVPLTPELKEMMSGAHAETSEAVEQAKSEASAWEAEVKADRERFDAEQSALTLEHLKSMSPADKRSTLIEMGFDAKAVKKMKDAELDGIISGKLEGERRKTKILGMTEEELAGLSSADKMQFLVDLGVDRKDLEKIGPEKAARAFDDVIRVAKIPGQHKVKVKIKGGLLGKSWEIKVNVDGEGNASFDAQKKGGFLSKLWGWVKLALPIILTLLGPVTGGISLVVLAVYQTATAIARGDWMGAIIGVAGAFVAMGALKTFAEGGRHVASSAAKAFKSIASVAEKVKKTAEAAKAAMEATKAKNPGGILAALAKGAGAFAMKAGEKASAFQQKMESWSQRLDKWSKIVQGGQTVAKGVKNKDPGMALGGAFDAAAAYVSKPNPQEPNARQLQFQRYSRLANFASAGQAAAKANPPNYNAIVDAAMGLATELKTKDGKAPKALEDAKRIVSTANKLSAAIVSKDPDAIAEAALALAETIQTAKYDEPEEPGKKDSDNDGISDDREKVLSRYAKANAIISFAGAAMDAAAKKPRPDYMSALTAATDLMANLTENKKIDQAAEIQRRLDAWTRAVQSKNEKLIEEAGIEFGKSINAMGALLVAERDEARKAAEAKGAPGEQVAGTDATLLSFDFTSRALETFKPTVLESPGVDAEEGLLDAKHPLLHTELVSMPSTASVSTSEEFRGVALSPRANTPGGNYTVLPFDTLSTIAVRFDTSVDVLRSTNPHLKNDVIYRGQRIYVPGAENLKRTNVTASVSDMRLAGPPEIVSSESVTVVPAEIPGDLKPYADWIKAIGGLSDVGAIKKAGDLLDALNDVLKKNGSAAKSDLDAYKAAVVNLKAVATSAEFASEAYRIVSDQLAPHFPSLDGLTLAPGTWQQVTRLKNRLNGLQRLANLGGIIEIVEKVSTLTDDKATPEARSKAAQDLMKVVASGSFTKEFKWLTAVARTVANRFGNHHVYAAMSVVRDAARRVTGVGDAIADTVGAWGEKIVTTLDKETGERVARKWAAEIAEWAAERQSGKIVTAVANRALAQALGRGLKSIALGPAGFALDVVQLQAELIAHLDRNVRYGTTHFFSDHLFGKSIDVRQREIIGAPIGTPAQCDAFFAYCETRMLAGGRYADVRRNWNTRWRAALPKAVSDLQFQAGRTISGNLMNQAAGTKTKAAEALKVIALQFLTDEFKRVFKRDP